MRILSKSYLMNINMTGSKLFKDRNMRPCDLDESSLVIKMVKIRQMRLKRTYP